MSSSWLSRLKDDTDIRYIVNDAISYAIDRFEKRLDELEIEKLEIPYATDLIMAKLHKIIDLSALQYDGVIFDNEPFEKFVPDGEPTPDKIDSWARGIGK
jgi:hypothetical protein